MSVDLLAFGAHPDDVELFAGGALHRMSVLGHTTAVCDLTRGELSTRGTPTVRKEESRDAARILGVEARENLDMPDGDVRNDRDSRLSVIATLRKHRPTVVVAPHPVSRHPDHARASELIRDACFLAGLSKIDTGREIVVPRKILYYYGHRFSSVPDIVIDITESFSEKMNAVRAYRSQFHSEGEYGSQTYLSRKEYLEEVEARARFFGSLIKVKYGEPFSMQMPIPVKDMMSFV